MMNSQWNDSIHSLTPQDTYRGYLKFKDKTVSKHAQQNHEIDVEIVNDQ